MMAIEDCEKRRKSLLWDVIHMELEETEWRDERTLDEETIRGYFS